jgi:hypothetical protein
MIDFKTLNFGDRIYVVNEQNNAFIKKKIHMTDESGNTWFRYDRDHWEYAISEIVYCGKVTHIEEGEVRFEEDRITEYHFRHPDGQIYHEWEGEDTDHLDNWFYTSEEAEAYIDFKKQTKNS